MKRACAAGACVALAACGKLEIGSYPNGNGPDASVVSVGNGGGGPGGTSASEGVGPVDDVLARAAVDGFFDAPPAAAFVLPSGRIAEAAWLHTFDAPPSDWIEPSFDGSGFAPGLAGFYSGTSMPEDRARTPWRQGAAELWARATFTIGSAEEIPDLVFWGRWDDTLEEVYVNGVLAASNEGWSKGYRYLGLREVARAALRIGDNTIAAHVVDNGGSKYFDLGLVRERRLSTRPRTGFERTPALALYADTVERFMLERGIPAGVLAVMKRDTVVVSRGLGWADKAMTIPIAEDAVLRVVTFDWLVTQAAIRNLIDSSEFTEDAAVFPLLAQRGLTPLPGLASNGRVHDVTLRHLLQREDGLRALPNPLQLYRDLEISAEQVTTEHVMRWIYGAGPEIVPGDCPSPGACGPVSDTVLKYFVHEHEGDLLAYLREVVLAQVGSSDIFPAHERLDGRSPREPGYFTLESPYDRWLQLEHQMRLAATAPALVRFARGYHLVYVNRLLDPVLRTWAPIPDNGTYFFVGGQDGSFDLLLQRLSDEVNIAVIFNIGGDYGVLADELEALTSSISEADWGL